MESTLVSSKDIVQAERWDFEYFSSEFRDTVDQIQHSGWVVKSLVEVITDLTDGQHGYLEHLPEGIPLLRTTNVLENEIRLDDVRYVAPEVHASIKRSQLKFGDVLLTTVGSIGIAAVVDESLGEANINQNLVKLTPKPDINPFYLASFLNSKLGRVQTAVTASKSVVPIISYPRLRKLLIPVPPRSLQDRIAQVIQNAYTARQEKLEKAEELLEQIDKYVFDKLGIFPESVKEQKCFLKPIQRIERGRFDVEFNMGFHKFAPYKEQVLPVNAIANFPKKTKNPTTKPEVLFNYIDISSVNIQLGEIGEVAEILGADAPSRARQVVHTGDIIISTVRPTRGATALIPEIMDKFICSTGFTIVHPTERVTSEYLHIALRLSTTLEQFGRRSAGSSYPAILERDVRETLIPVPAQEIQREIAAEVGYRRTEAKRLRTEAETLVAEAKARVGRMILGEEDGA